MLYYTAKLKMPEDTLSTEIERKNPGSFKDGGSGKRTSGNIHQKTVRRSEEESSIAVELLADPSYSF